MLQRARVQQSCEAASAIKSSSKLPNSPVQLAKTWGTLIWTPEHTLKFLEKVANTYRLHYVDRADRNGGHKVKSANVKRLKGDYIKVEAIQKHYRPYYLEIKNWPTVNINCKYGQCPFVPDPHKEQQQQQALAVQQQQIKENPNSVAYGGAATAAEKLHPHQQHQTQKSTMTRKSRSKQMLTTKQTSSDKQCGHCEICRIEYDVLSVHLQSKEHVNFVKNRDNFLTLDNLINSGASVEQFLQVNKSPPRNNDIDNGVFGKRTGKKVTKIMRGSGDDVKDIKQEEIHKDLNGGLTCDNNSVHEEPEHTLQYTGSSVMTRRSNSRKCDVEMQKQPSVKQSAEESTKEKVSKPVTEEEDNEDSDDTLHPATKVRARRESAKRVNYAELKEDEETSNDSKSKLDIIRIRGIRWRPPSSENRKSSVAPALYKVIDNTSTSTKEKSSKCGNKSAVDNINSNTTPTSGNAGGGIKVRIARVRESELSLLTNEADNFMFPRVSSSDVVTDDDRQSTSENERDVSQDIPSSDIGTRYSRARKSSDSSVKELDPSNKKKRRKQLEAFLNDNSDYYKFQNTDYRLRFQETPFQPSLIKSSRNDCTTTSTRSIGATRTAPTELRRTSNIKSMINKRHISVGGGTSSDADSIRDTEDRKGVDSYAYDKGNNDLLRMHKFAFERIPSTEPWFEAFQRQDECRERIFEYWGSTGNYFN